MPFAGPQSVAKRALLGMAEALRQELAPWNIPVVLIEPASIRTSAIDKLRRDATAAQDPFGAMGRKLYGAMFQRVMDTALTLTEKGSTPDTVADVVSRAVRAARPRSCYRCGKHAARLAVLATLPPFALDRVRRRIFGLPAPGSLLDPARAAAPLRTVPAESHRQIEQQNG